LNGINQIDFLRSIQKYYVAVFSNLPKNCPVKKNKYSSKNVTLLQERGADAPKPMLSTQMPNGIYRHCFRFRAILDQLCQAVAEQDEIVKFENLSRDKI